MASLDDLAERVRRLIDVTVTVDAPAAALDTAIAGIDRVLETLRVHVPEPPLPRYPMPPGGNEPAALFPYDMVIGRLSPLAPPLRIEWCEPKVIGRVCFGTPYEGPPGCVHGAAIAAAFDQVFNVANLMMGTPGPTRRLELRYQRPTPLRRELRFEAWRERVEDRKVFTAGRLLAGDEVTVEAEGLFVVVPFDKVMRMLDP